MQARTWDNSIPFYRRDTTECVMIPFDSKIVYKGDCDGNVGDAVQVLSAWQRRGVFDRQPQRTTMPRAKSRWWGLWVQHSQELRGGGGAEYR